MNDRSTVWLLDPTLAAGTEAIPPAPRLATLDGAAIGLVNNGKTHGREILERVAENLGRKYRLGDVRLLTKPSSGYPPEDEDVEMLAEQCMAIVAAIGD